MSPMYPFVENIAGSVRDSHKTGKSREALMANREIISLSKELLSKDVYSKAESLASMLVGTRSEKSTARNTITKVLLPPPKRPVYYLEHELKFLPRWTRESMRYLGDFVDMLTKAAVYEKEMRQDVFKIAFGPAISRFKNYYPNRAQLVDWLERYNRFLYRDAKHDFDLPTTRQEHRFTSREVVHTLFVTKELTEKITALSAAALRVSRDEPI
jgi:hypothetical protein